MLQSVKSLSDIQKNPVEYLLLSKVKGSPKSIQRRLHRFCVNKKFVKSFVSFRNTYISILHMYDMCAMYTYVCARVYTYVFVLQQQGYRCR